MATETLLDRIQEGAYGEVSGAAVHELHVFLGELRDFFNAGSLQDMLAALQPALDPPSLQVPSLPLSSLQVPFPSSLLRPGSLSSLRSSSSLSSSSCL